MNQYESRQSQSKLDTNEGWVVQVYGSDRRLLCVLEPSHGWVFLIGCGVGLLLSVIWFNFARYSPPLESMPPADAPAKSPALQVD